MLRPFDIIVAAEAPQVSAQYQDSIMQTVSQHFIGGQFVASHGQEIVDIHNPASGSLLGRATLGNQIDAECAIASAKAAFASWSATTLSERKGWLQRLADEVTRREDDLTSIMIAEFGALASFARFAAKLSSAFFVHAQDLLEPANFETKIGRATISKVPLGVAGLLTPWNGDAMFICGKAAWALAAGCTVVVKPSELSVLQTQVLMECFEKAALPPGVINIVNGRGDPVGNTITRSPDVRKISFTGSTSVGKMINREATETMKRVTLELGGKSPTIILDDADMAKAVEFALRSGLYNTGQGCIAGTRILVPESRLEEAKSKFKIFIEAMKIGNPAEPDTVIQPLVSHAHWKRVQGYIAKGIAEGATVLTGGEGKPAGFEVGNYVKPTIFVGVSNAMTIAQEEIFGPVLSLISYTDDAHAVEIANDSPYGLYAYIFGRDLQRARAIADRIQAGTIMINEIVIDVTVPFGGFKMSGLGSEYGTDGLHSFLESRAVFGGYD